MRKMLLALVVSAVFLLNTAIVSAESTRADFDTAKLDTGVIGISYTSSVQKIKVLIEKNDKRYAYNLNNGGVEESFSLQMGNGDYKVSVLENTSGDKYKYISTKNVTLNMADKNQVYLTSVQNVNWDEDKAAVRKAKELTENLDSNKDKLDAIYEYIVSNFRYDHNKLGKLETTYLPDIDDTLSTKKGICYDYASTFAAMLRSIGIPAKLVKGYSTNVNGYHAWNEVFLEDTSSWIIIDTTYDSQMKEAKAKYNMEKKAAQYTKVNEY